MTSFITIWGDTPPSSTDPETSSVHPGLKETKHTVVLGPWDPTAVFVKEGCNWKELETAAT